MRKLVYTYDESDPEDVKLLGGKGAGLVLMYKHGLPVPPGITITTEACSLFYSNGERLPEGLMDQVREAMAWLEEKTGRRFGDPRNPLLVSVRSGAPVSMPGMMDTVLNLGLNDETLQGLIDLTGDERFAYDAYRRFLQMFGSIVLGVDKRVFDEIFEEVKARRGAKYDAELKAEDLKEVVRRFKEVLGDRFPQDPWKQLELAIMAVFRSWNSPRAVFYRKANNITPDIADGTAVNIVAMVFGNMGFDSGTGVLFTRDPATGENVLYGEFLPNAQGEDVVAGIRTPKSIEELRRESPHLYEQIYEMAKRLERVKKEVQDIEFTIEKGKVYLLQTRNAKMTPLARVRTVVDMYREGLLTKEEALARVKPEHIIGLLYPRLDESYLKKHSITPIAEGLNASPGAATGRVVFDADTAVEWASRGERVILVREETRPDDVHGFYASQGILTSRGGMTSHASVVARAIGKPAVVGAERIRIDYERREFRVDGITVREGDVITIDGFTGKVYLGEIPTAKAELPSEFFEILRMADEVRRLGVRANADTPEDAEIAKRFGAEGIGLLRTERMFRRPERLSIFQQVIMARTSEERREAMNKLVPFLKKDFLEIFRVMEGLKVTVRLFDPPLHEFLPSSDELLERLCDARMRGDGEEVSRLEALLRRVRELREANPMMGHRGVRVGVTYPEIYEAQVRAIVEAYLELRREGKDLQVQIMIPQVSDHREIRYVKEHAIEPVFKEYGIRMPVGTMIEVVRACITADKIAKETEFFSFGTNDLTQGVFTFSRDDVENKFMHDYLEKGILDFDVFQSLDTEGVGELMRIAVERGRASNPQLEIGICGEHGGDPRSIEFCHRIGLDYVSASAFRVPVARLSAAHAVLKERGVEFPIY
ncbi:MAG: pyruvate, phosphate dikinase [Candidatus Korarchaeota archaeon NZ13-K]|nr:MAG: pyruvate, phosphate dikinase [Candidatus Korarchaeota archaeon NZ13-K]